MSIADNLDAAAAALVAENVQLQALVSQFEATIPAEALIADVLAGTAANLFLSPRIARETFMPMIQATNWYVDGANGDDSHSGLSMATAFKTAQAAIDYVSSFVCPGTVRIHLNGAVGPMRIETPSIANLELAGSGVDLCTVNALSLSANGGRGITVSGSSTRVVIHGFSINSYYECVAAQAGAVVSGWNATVRMATSGYSAIAAYSGAKITLTGDIKYSAASASTGVLLTSAGGGLIECGYNDGVTVSNVVFTAIGAPVVASFASASKGGQVQFLPAQCSFAGAVTGQRYFVGSGGVIDTSGSGAAYLPGTLSGVNSNGYYI